MATIGDVARYAGVSRSTVSHALSGKRPISLETRERIAEAVAALHYTANAGARALATSKSSILALIVPFTPDEFAPATLQYVLTVAETARNRDYDVVMITEEEGTAGITRITESNLADGVILLDVKRDDERIASVIESGKPGVLVGMPDTSDGVDCVDLDFGTSAHLLVRHLFDQGHRHVIFITLPENLFAQDLAYAWHFRTAALATAAELGVELVLVAADADPATRATDIGRALDANPDATALLVHNDGVLVELPLILQARELAVPADLSVVSIFPEQFGRMFSLPYTAIETSASTVAARAVDLLAQRIGSSNREFARELIEPIIIDRGTSKKI
jgi:DNA-binding LacI/PurR family transcriptional regulator